MIKIKRTFPEPKSLVYESKKVSGAYNKPDVVKQLKEDSHDKCYICELKGLQDPVVEHLLPHENGKYPERKFDWNNLFLACPHCNSIKNDKKYYGNIIDCCKQDPEKLIDFKYIEGNVIVKAKDETNVKAFYTAELVSEVFNKRNTGMRIEASENRLKALTKEMNELYTNLEKLQNNSSSGLTLRKLKALLSRESAFAAFKRYYVKNNLEKYPQLKEYLDSD